MRNLALIDQGKFVIGLDAVLPSTSTPGYVSMRNANRLTILILVKNATTVTGAAITLKQASNAAVPDEKALAFDTMYANVDTAASDTMVKTAVTSNTFTTNSTNSKNLMYQIEVKASDLDVANGFDRVRVGVGDATANLVTVLYFLHMTDLPALAIAAKTTS